MACLKAAAAGNIRNLLKRADLGFQVQSHTRAFPVSNLNKKYKQKLWRRTCPTRTWYSDTMLQVIPHRRGEKQRQNDKGLEGQSASGLTTTLSFPVWFTDLFICLFIHFFETGFCVTRAGLEFVTEANLELRPPPKSWGYIRVLPCPVYVALGIEPRTTEHARQSTLLSYIPVPVAHRLNRMFLCFGVSSSGTTFRIGIEPE